MNKKHDKTENKVDLWQDLEGLRRKKEELDRKYAEILAEMDTKSAFNKSFTE